jgi:parvulin-like peptidyl-prolyl isomerase
MMNYFRKYAAPLIVVTGLAFFIWLVVDLSGVTGNGGVSSATTVGKVNGQAIDARTYELAVQNATEQAQQQSSATLGTDDIARIRDQVWSQFVDEAILESEYRKRHLTASPAEVAAAMEQQPPEELQNVPDFQTGGKFDVDKYHRWLRSPAAQPAIAALEPRYRDEILQSKMLQQVTGDIFVSPAELWRQYRDAHETVTIDLMAIIPRNAVPDSAVPVTAADVEAYYKAHPAEFRRPATAFLSFVALPHAPDRADTAAALAHAEAVRDEILKGAPFAEVAKRESADSGSAVKGGDLGEWTRGKMVKPFDSAAFSLPIGKLSEPVLSQFGYHIIQVSKRSGDKATARHILIPITLSPAHRDSVDARADSLERLAADRVDGPALDSAARIMGLRVGRVGPVAKGSQALIGSLVVPDVSTWAFEERKPGSIGSLIETESALFLFRIDSILPEGTPPLAQIRLAVETSARQARKVDAARAIGQDVLKRLSEGSSLAQAADAHHLPHEVMGPFTRINPSIGNPLVVGTAFGLKVGQRSPLLDTPDGLYLFEVKAHVPADSADFAKNQASLMFTAMNRARQDRVRSYLSALHQGAAITDNRDKLFQAEQQASNQAS